MTMELEETLARELREVADGIQVPPMPALAPVETRSRAARTWQPLLVAASVALIVGLVALTLGRGDDSTPQPAPSPTVTSSDKGGSVSNATPTVAYILGPRLFVDGDQVPGAWSFVESRGDVWLGQKSEGSWWWSNGTSAEPMRIDAQIDQPPAISPNGGYVGYVDVSGGEATLTGFDTQPAGEGFGPAPIENLPVSEDGVPIRVRAVTDEGDVIVQGTRTSLMWRALFQDQRTVVDLTGTASDQVILEGTPVGLVVVDGADGATDATSTAPYLADISVDGELTPQGELPTYSDISFSPEGSWLVRAPAGTLGGEVDSLSSLTTQPVGGTEETILTPPEGWVFSTSTWTWEDEDTLITVLLPEDRREQLEVLSRCSIGLATCSALGDETPGAEPQTFTAAETLDAVIEAVVAGERSGLADETVVDDGLWNELAGFADGAGGSGSTCRDNGEGTQDCEISFDAAPDTVYYAILEPAQNGYGWRVTYVGIGGA
ncbi:hypothetical protein [Nocardioides pacificus]